MWLQQFASVSSLAINAHDLSTVPYVSFLLRLYSHCIICSLSFCRYALWGMAGAILAIPITAVLRIIVQSSDHPYAHIVIAVMEGRLSAATAEIGEALDVASVAGGGGASATGLGGNGLMDQSMTYGDDVMEAGAAGIGSGRDHANSSFSSDGGDRDALGGGMLIDSPERPLSSSAAATATAAMAATTYSLSASSGGGGMTPGGIAGGIELTQQQQLQQQRSGLSRSYGASGISAGLNAGGVGTNSSSGGIAAAPLGSIYAKRLRSVGGAGADVSGSHHGTPSPAVSDASELLVASGNNSAAGGVGPDGVATDLDVRIGSGDGISSSRDIDSALHREHSSGHRGGDREREVSRERADGHGRSTPPK